MLDGGRIVADGAAAELKRLVSGGHSELRLPDAATLDTAARWWRRRLPTPRRSPCPFPRTGGIGSLRPVLARLDGAGIAVDDPSITMPDLEDVFFALTGTTNASPVTDRRSCSHDRRPRPLPAAARSHVVADAITMLRRNLLHMIRYPELSVFAIVAVGFAWSRAIYERKSVPLSGALPIERRRASRPGLPGQAGSSPIGTEP